MAEATFNNFAATAFADYKYTNQGLTVENGVTFEDGGYCQIGSLVIIQTRVKLTTAYAGGTAKTICSGYPIPSRPEGTLVPYFASSHNVRPYINSQGVLALAAASNAVSANTSVTISGCYFTSATPPSLSPEIEEIPVSVNLIYSLSGSSVYRNNSYRMGQLVQFSIIFNITTAVAQDSFITIASNSTPPLCRDLGTYLYSENVAIDDIPSWDNHRLRMTTKGVVLQGPLPVGQYTFSGTFLTD